MAAKTLNDFLLAGVAASDDFVVGFDTAVAGGERKWTVATIANAVSGVMTPQLNSAFFNSTDVIPIAKGGTGQTTAFAGLVALANGGASTAGKYLKVNAGNTALEYDTIDLSTADVTGVLPVANGGTGGSTGGGSLTLATAQVASGTSVNFTGIPSSAKRINVMFSGVSTDLVSDVLIRLGTSSGIENSGYISHAMYDGSERSGTVTSGIILEVTSVLATVRFGTIVLSLIGSNTWVSAGSIGGLNLNSVMVNNNSNGTKTMPAALDRIQITTVGGTASFDAGTINISYEG